MMLDRYSINRFSIGYCPLFAILAADGVRRLTRGWPRTEALAGATLIASFFVWTLPALAIVRHTVSPSVLAVEAVRQHLDPHTDELFVARDMDPFFQYLLPNYAFVHVLDKRALPLSMDSRHGWILAEADADDRDGFVFHRERGHLWNIARRHYFDAGVIPARTPPQFIAGWYAPVREAPFELRSMTGRSLTRLPASTGETMLRIQYHVPDALVAGHATISIALNGRVIDRFAADYEGDREYDVTPAPNSAPNLLDLSIDQTIHQPRELGMTIRCLSFGPG
jgi:hypothetical protein